MNLHRPTAIAAIALISLSACSSGEDSAVNAPEQDIVEPDIPPMIDTAELVGEWCYVRYEAGGEASEENINYVFNNDGTLLYQTDPSAPVDQPGSYSVIGNQIEISPAFSDMSLTISSFDETQMVLDGGMALQTWTHGPCLNSDEAMAEGA